MIPLLKPSFGNSNEKTLFNTIFFFHNIFFYWLYYLSKYLGLPSPPQNFLILGLDPRNDLLEKTETTDTIIFAHLNLSQNKISLISFPRDLWYYPLSVKINQIFPLSLSTDSSFNFVKTNFNHLLGQNIDRVLVLTTQDLEHIINLLGGVDVYLDTGFIDKEYPNPEYIKNPTSKTPVYITIEFPAGWNKITATNVAQFVRSRKSAQTAADGGTDLGRIQRQQLLLQNIFQKDVNPQNSTTDSSQIIPILSARY